MATETNWQKSSFSGGGDGDECVEIAALDRLIHLRESDDPTRILPLTPDGLAALLARIRASHA
jgi:hypothetical protein